MPSEGFLAMGGGILLDFLCACGLPGGTWPCWVIAGIVERCPAKFISSATKFLFRSAWASGEDGVSMTSFLELLAKMKLAVEAGDLWMGDTWPSLASPAVGSELEAAWPGRVSLLPLVRSASLEVGASLEDKVEVFSRTAFCSWFKGTVSLEEGDCRRDRDLRMGFWGTCWGCFPTPSAPCPFWPGVCLPGPAGACPSTLTERRRTICSREGVTMGRLASSFGVGLLLLRETGSFLGSNREPFVVFLRLA